jgi:hypothetical protein
MADDLLNTNGNAEVDPAAEFLAREQDELAELGEDFQTEENGDVSSQNSEQRCRFDMIVEANRINIC